MTLNKYTFTQWYKRRGGAIVNNFPRIAVLEIKPIEIRRGNNALDPSYIMCIAGKEETLTDGSIASGLQLQEQLQPTDTILIFFVKTREEAYNLLHNAVRPIKVGIKPVGTGVYIPTSINAFKAWCTRNSITPNILQRMPHFDPRDIGINAQQRDYYWAELNLKDLRSEIQLDHVPHKIEDDKITILLKTGGQYKPKTTLLIEKALLNAQLQRTEQAARFYVELFLQHKVAGVNIQGIQWNAPDLGLQLVNHARMHKEEEC